MPIDTSFYSNVAPVQIDPFRAMAQAQSFRIQKEQAETQREYREAIAAQRRQQTEAAAQALEDRQGFGNAIKQGKGVRADVLTWAQENAPNSVPGLTKFFDESEKSAADVKKLQGDLNNARLNHQGHLADGVLQNGATPGAIASGLALYSEQFPEEAPQIAKLGEQLAGKSPAEIKAYLEQVRGAAPFWQEKAAKNTPQVVGRDQALVDDGGKVLYEAPEKTKPVYRVSADKRTLEQVGDVPAGAQVLQEAQPPRINITAGGTANDPKDIARAIIAGEQPPDMTGLYRNAGPVRAELARQGYNLTTAQTDWKAAQKHFATLNGAQQTRIRQAIDTASHSLDVIDGLADQWNAGQFPLLNAATLKAAKGGAMGKDAQAIATQLDAQITDVTSELGNVYMGGNSPTDHALSLAAKNLSANWSKDTLKTLTKLARTNLQIRSNAIKNVNAIGASPDNPYAPAVAPPALVYDPKTKQFTKPGGGS